MSKYLIYLNISISPSSLFSLFSLSLSLSSYPISRYLLDGVRFYADEVAQTWVEFPKDWYKQGAFKAEEEPIFEVWVSPEGEEYVTTVKDDGKR